jgi:hypothetical protein
VGEEKMRTRRGLVVFFALLLLLASFGGLAAFSFPL